MSFVILRTAKIKTRGELGGSAGHNFREQPTPNADHSRLQSNQHLFSTSKNELLTKFESRFKVAEDAAKKAGRAIRSDAVLCIEYLITASPEAWKKNGFNDKQYFGDALKFLQETHGAANVIGASVHRDETTPHLVAYVVPLDKKENLNCKSFLGSAKKLSELQDAAQSAFGQKHGLTRGIKNSSAEHVPVREFYKKVNAATPNKPKPLPTVPDATLSERILESAGLETEHSKAVETTLAMAKTQISVLQKRSEILDAKLKIADLQKSNYQRAIVENSDLKEIAKNRASGLRELPLAVVLEKFGATISPNDKNNYDTEAGRISVNGSKFFNHDTNKGGGGAIDLIMNIHNCDYKTAVSTLSNEFGSDAVTAAVASNPRAAAAAIIAATPIKSSLPDDVSSRWADVRTWLNSSRKIAFSIIDSFRKNGILRADTRGNAVFVNSERTGAEIRGKAPNFKGYRGSRGLVIYTKNEEKKTAFLVESGTDAMAFAMHPKSSSAGLVVSVGGDFGQRTIEQLKALQGKGFQLICATDSDESGDAKFRLMKKELEVGGKVILREKPNGRDWQDDMKTDMKNEKNLVKKEIFDVKKNNEMRM